MYQRLFVFAVLLLAAALLSPRERRGAYSNSVLFLLAGMAGVELEISQQERTAALVRSLAQLALFVVLFLDGMRVPLPALRACWRLPGRALVLGMPVTVLLLGLLAHWLLRVPWLQAWLVAAVLSPTDPVFASTLVKSDAVSRGLRRLLNVESGLNDGVALPLVLGLLAMAGASGHGFAMLGLEAAGGVCLGVVLAGAAALLRRRVRARLERPYCTVFVLALGILLYAAAHLSGANEYLAAFTAAMTLATCAPGEVKSFRAASQSMPILLKYAAVMAFGALVGWDGIASATASELLFAALALLVARPAAILSVLAGSSLAWRERLAAAWFGPKGFSSLVYAVIVGSSGTPDAWRLFHVCALVVLISMVAHSSTAVAVARWLRQQGDAADGG